MALIGPTTVLLATVCKAMPGRATNEVSCGMRALRRPARSAGDENPLHPVRSGDQPEQHPALTRTAAQQAQTCGTGGAGAQVADRGLRPAARWRGV